MNKSTLVLGVGSFALMLLSGCGRDCGGTFSVPQECKDYGYFLKGSYWTYQNDSTLELDSFSTVFDTIGWFMYEDGNEGCNEQTNTNAPFYFRDEYTTSIASSIVSGDSIEYSCGTGGVDFNVNNKFLGIYFIPNARQFADSSQWDVINAIIINGSLYLDAYVSTYVNNTKVFFQENVGVIKFERLIDSSNYVESWSIVRYNTIQ